MSAYATREPPKMSQFDLFAISGYWAISHDRDLNLRIWFSSQNSLFRSSRHANKKKNAANKEIKKRKLYCIIFLECSRVVYTKTIIHLSRE